MKKLALILVLVVVGTAFLCADVYIKQHTKTGAMMGQPAKDITNETWLGDNKMAMISSDTSMIMDMGAKKVFIITHATKSYVETDLPLDITKLMPEQMAGMVKSMMDGMTVSVQPNGQTKKVANWNCKGYDFDIVMMGMKMKMTMWATSDVPFDWKKYKNLYGELYKATMRMGEKFMQEFEKMDGYPVATELEMEMMGQKIESSTTTLEIKKQDAGAGVYSVPAGYAKKDKLSMGGMR